MTCTLREVVEGYTLSFALTVVKSAQTHYIAAYHYSLQLAL